MAQGSVRLVKRPNFNRQVTAVKQEIARQLRGVGQAHVDAREKVVADFDHKPEFEHAVKISSVQITMTISLSNASEQVSEGFTMGDLWEALDKKGVRPHTIRAKKPGGRLAFQTGYQPHTRPIARSGGPGRPSGPTIFRKEVKHPGFPPRKFSDSINKRLRRQFEAAVDRGFRLGAKRR